MANALSVELHPQGNEVASGSGPVVEIGEARSAARLTLRTLSGAGDLFVKVETSPDGLAGWRQVAAFDNVEQHPRKQLIHMDDLDPFMRVSWVLDGGGNATFIVSGRAHTLFALQEDVHGELPAAFLKKATNDLMAEKLMKASTHAESAAYAANPIPLTSWDLDFTQHVAMLAAFEIMTFLGFVPQGTDEIIVMKWKAARKYFEGIRNRKEKPPGLEPAAFDDTQTSSGDPDDPDKDQPRMSDNWGDF